MSSSVLNLLCLLIYVVATLAQTACNGNAALCSRKYSSVSQIGTHDSAFVGTLPQDNQDISITDQLNAGIRFLQAQSHKDPFGILSLCHTSCYLADAGSVQSYLAAIKSWLDANPNEVLTVLLTNGDSVDVGLFDAAFTDSGVKPYAFVPASAPNVLALDAWPTLQDMITAGKRLVVFLDYGADVKRYPYILDEFAYFFETPYDTTDPNFAECTLDRPPNSSPDGKMYIVNHFLDISVFGILIPDNPRDQQTNAATGSGSIGAQVALCEGIYKRNPKAVLVDYFDKGDVFTAERSMNGL